MATFPDPGTPIGGERMRRLRDVCQRLMSPSPEDFNIASPVTPPSSTAVTLEAIANLLDAKLSPIVENVEELKNQVANFKGDLKAVKEELQMKIDQNANKICLNKYVQACFLCH